MRVYVRGVIIEQLSGKDGFRQFSLNIIDVGFRFTDDFSFEGKQPLGAWKYDLENVEKPVAFKNTFIEPEWHYLYNSTYSDLRNKLPQLGGDFKIRTPLLFFANQSPKDVIFFIKSKEK